MVDGDALSAGLLALRLPRVWPRRRSTAAFEWLIALAWGALLWWSLAGSGSGSGSGRAAAGMASIPAGMGSMPGMRMSAHPSAAGAAVIGLPMWTVMSVAMMLPGALPALSHVSTHSFRWRRGRSGRR